MLALGTILLLLGQPVVGVPGVDATYTLELVRKPFPSVHITLAIEGTVRGETRFSIADRWGGNSDFENEIHQLRVRNGSGKVLPTKRDPLTHTWTVRHAAGERLTLDYFVVSTLHEVTSDSTSYYRPIVTANLFHMIGHTGLIAPNHLGGTEKRRIHVRWKGFKQAGWKVACSFSVEQESFTTTQKMDDFVHSVFLAGDLRIHTRKSTPGTLAFAIHGDDWGFKDKELVELGAKIVKAERTFFGESDESFYLITLIPVGQYREGSTSIGGTGLAQSFALFMTPRVRLGTDEQGLRIRYLLAHEHFHHWNGGVIEPDEPEELVYWFTEGFTDFYTRRLLYRTGLYSLENYLQDVNRKLSSYMLSPVADAPNHRIQVEFWTDDFVHRLPYLRGDLLAVVVDHEIRKTSKGTKSLDDLMKKVLADTRDGQRRLTTEYLIGVIGNYTSLEFAEKIRGVVNDGKAPDIPLLLFEPCATGYTESIGAFDIGFDWDTSRNSRIVTGVRVGSAAHRAGARDGQTLLGWSVTYGHAEKPVELTIVGLEGQKTISYLPQAGAKKVPQFKAKRPRTCRDLL